MRRRFVGARVFPHRNTWQLMTTHFRIRSYRITIQWSFFVNDIWMFIIVVIEGWKSPEGHRRKFIHRVLAFGEHRWYFCINGTFFPGMRREVCSSCLRCHRAILEERRFDVMGNLATDNGCNRGIINLVKNGGVLDRRLLAVVRRGSFWNCRGGGITSGHDMEPISRVVTRNF